MLFIMMAFFPCRMRRLLPLGRRALGLRTSVLVGGSNETKKQAGEERYPTYTPDDDLDAWKDQMEQKYGPGSFPLYRALYKDLCDEMRREINTKPPPPMDGFTTHHTPGTDYVVFTRDSKEDEKGSGRIFAYGKLRLADPTKMNEMLTFLNWYPIEVCMVRDGLVLQASIGNVESQFHMRNIKVYPDPNGDLTTQYTNEANYLRNIVTYDGPYWGHLEADLQSELHDTVFDHGINPDSLHWFTEWVSYLEHFEYTRWSLMMQKAILSGGVEKEEDVLTRGEREQLDLATEEWLPSRNV